MESHTDIHVNCFLFQYSLMNDTKEISFSFLVKIWTVIKFYCDVDGGLLQIANINKRNSFGWDSRYLPVARRCCRRKVLKREMKDCLFDVRLLMLDEMKHTHTHQTRQETIHLLSIRKTNKTKQYIARFVPNIFF